MKTPLAVLFLFAAACAQAAVFPAKITEETKLEFTRGKGSVMLKAGTPIDVVSQDGDTLEVLYRGTINGRVLRAKTDFKGEAPKVAATPHPEPAPAGPAPKPSAPPPAKPAETKPAAPAAGTPAAPANPPTTIYGKAVQKARENEAKHKENLVDPANEAVGAKKKDGGAE